jgi:hypothetical protein
MAKVIPFPAKPYVDDYFGGCPRCGNNDGCTSIGRSHWYFCKAHRTKWCVGSNLFSSWRDQTVDEQRRAYTAIGLGYFAEVKPLPCSDPNRRNETHNEGEPPF